MTLIQIFVFAVFLIVLAMLYRNDHQDTQTINAQNSQRILTELEASPLYKDYALAACECVRNNYQACTLVRPGDFINHLAPLGTGVFEDRFGRIIFCYKFTRSVATAKIGEITYSTLSIRKMASTLNQSLPNYCLAYGLSPISIIGGKNDNNGTVIFCICPFASLQEAKQYLGWR